MPHTAKPKPNQTCSSNQIFPLAAHPKAAAGSQPMVAMNTWLLIKLLSLGVICHITLCKATAK